jgi:uncharacterized protein
MAVKKNRFTVATAIQAIVFLIVVLTGIFIHYNEPVYNWLTVILFMAALAYFYKSKISLFGPVLFFTLAFLAAMLPFARLGLLMILPLIVYVIIISLAKPVKSQTHWLKLGKIDKTTWLFGLMIIVITSIVLVLWNMIINPNISDIMAIIPKWSFGNLLLLGIGFALLNSIIEESIYRGIIWDAAATFSGNIKLIIITQSVLFGVAHIQGFPRGTLGVILAFFYGIILGIVKNRTKGLLAPIIFHFAADLTIFFILLKMLGRF